MSGFQSPITINQAMQYIRNNEYLLPAFQREYVWYPEQIEALFDSLMRDYPISSMLLWKVKDESKTSWKFYRFLDYFREEYHIHNDACNTAGHRDFFAVLDGQQRLTSIYLALFSHYDIHKTNCKWQDDDKYFKISHLYFNLTQSQKPKDSDIEYEFLWLDRKITEEKTIYIDKYGQKWFKCSAFYLYETTRVRKIVRDFKLEEKEEERLDIFHQKIFDKQIINYYLEEEQDPDKAVNIFIRINAGGEPLDYSDILFSTLIANWESDARKEIHDLIETINDDFKIDKDLILKGFLYLYHSNIKFQIGSFSKDFSALIEQKWERIKICFIETFELLASFGLSGNTFPAYNAALPILYFIYHNNLENTIVRSVSQSHNRDLIKKWVLRAILFKPFSSSSDTVLAGMRRAFVEHFDGKAFLKNEVKGRFPLESIEKESGRYGIDDDFFDAILSYRKAKPEAFAALSLLFPSIDDKRWVFHRDHLHPASSYEQYERICKEKGIECFPRAKYDSLPNLQLLEGHSNQSKQDKSLKDWVELKKKEGWHSVMRDCLIPECDLSLENFNNFYEARKEIMKNRLKEILER